DMARGAAGDYACLRNVHRQRLTKSAVVMRFPRSWRNFPIRSWWEQPYYRSLWRQMVAAPTEYPASRFKGRGLVYCILEEGQFENLWVGLCLLRRVLKCDLPIEIWHFGQRDLMARMSAPLDTCWVRIVDGDSFSRELAGHAGSEHALKALSIAHSS